MILTREILEKGKSERGGWNRNQLEVLGVAWPPRQGWKSDILGKELSDSSAEAFLRLTSARKRTRTPKSTVAVSMRKRALSKRRKAEKRGRMNKGKWAEKVRLELLSKDNPAERHIDVLLSQLPLVFRREHPLIVDKDQYFLDFLVTSLKNPRRRVRVGIEVDGGYHYVRGQQKKDAHREKNLLATSRVRRILRIDSKMALSMTKDTLYKLISSCEEGSVTRVGGIADPASCTPTNCTYPKCKCAV